MLFGLADIDNASGKCDFLTAARKVCGNPIASSPRPVRDHRSVRRAVCAVLRRRVDDVLRTRSACGRELDVIQVHTDYCCPSEGSPGDRSQAGSATTNHCHSVFPTDTPARCGVKADCERFDKTKLLQARGQRDRVAMQEPR